MSQERGITHEVRSPGSLKSDSGSRLIQPNKAVKRVTAMKPVSNISDSDSDSEDAGSPQMPSESIMGWYYMDPKRKQQGPFFMNLLHTWEQKGFFDKNFKVWRVGQSIRDANWYPKPVVTQCRFTLEL